jgi:hypothetical protein
MDAVASRATYLAPFHWREAALCGPAMPILLGEWSGWPAGGAVAAGSAFAVGFGAARELRGRRWAAMVGALAGMTVAAFLGTVLGQHSVIFLVSAALAATGCAALALPEVNMTSMQPLLPTLCRYPARRDSMAGSRGSRRSRHRIETAYVGRQVPRGIPIFQAPKRSSDG